MTIDHRHPFSTRLSISSDTGQKSQVRRDSVFCFLMSLGIELLQPFFDRFSDITDLITNLIGGALGYGIYAILKPISFWILERLKTR